MPPIVPRPAILKMWFLAAAPARNPSCQATVGPSNQCDKSSGELGCQVQMENHCPRASSTCLRLAPSAPPHLIHASVHSVHLPPSPPIPIPQPTHRPFVSVKAWPGGSATTPPSWNPRPMPLAPILLPTLSLPAGFTAPSFRSQPPQTAGSLLRAYQSVLHMAGT